MYYLYNANLKALQNLGGSKKESVESVASRIAMAIKELRTKYFVEGDTIIKKRVHLCLVELGFI